MFEEIVIHYFHPELNLAVEDIWHVLLLPLTAFTPLYKSSSYPTPTPKTTSYQ